MANMNKNDFAGNPVRLDAPRSKFPLNMKHKTTFNAGRLIPIFSYGDVMPGDTFKIDLSCLVRMTTPVFPTMDDAYLDVYFFFTPHKLTLSRSMMSPSVNDSNRSWAAFIGAQDSLLNMPLPSEVELPFCWLGYYDLKNGSLTYNAPELGSLADYLGIGLSSSEYGISCLEPLAYYSVWNNYFRDENTQQPVVFSLLSAYSDSVPDLVGRMPVHFQGGVLGIDQDDLDYLYWGYDDSEGSGIGSKKSICPVSRPHGYFGSALPWPQRNAETVEIPLLGSAPVVADGSTLFAGAQSGVTFNPTALNDDNLGYFVFGANNASSWNFDRFNEEELIYKSGLKADLSQASGISVNQLRLMVQTQRFYEALARGGNRIGEMTASMFGVTPSDYAQDRPEYLGGKRIPINIDQVANTAGSSAGSQGQTLGSLGAYSNTGDSSYYFEKSFDTWGTITCVCCVRTNETFSQGLPRRYSRKNRLDFYWPQFANIGEQPILNRELYIEGDYDTDDDVFGYQEAWAEYRYLPDIVSGHLRPDQDLGSYTYANDFDGAPTLAGYLKGGDAITSNVDRTLVVPSTTAGFQFIGDFSFHIVATRPMPLYSIPGLVDHH